MELRRAWFFTEDGQVVSALTERLEPLHGEVVPGPVPGTWLGRRLPDSVLRGAVEFGPAR